MIRKKDYQKKDLKNPFFPKRNKENRSTKKNPLIFFVILLSLFFLILLLFNNIQQLKITQITVKGVEFIDDSEIEELIAVQLTKRRWLLFNQSNIFFFDKSEAARKIQETYLLNDIKIRKKYLTEIEVNLENNNSGLIWANDISQFYLDLEGKVTKQIDSTKSLVLEGEFGGNVIRSGFSMSKYPLLKDLSNREAVIGEKIVPVETIKFILDLTDQLKTKADFDVSYFEINRPAAEDITLVTQEGWFIKFSLENSVSSQINSLFTVLNQRVLDRSRLEYIDLRFGEKIFWQ